MTVTASATESTAQRPRPARKLRLPSPLQIVAVLCLAFLIGPLIVVIGAALNDESMSFPPRQLTIRWMIDALTQGDFLNGAIVSLLTASVSSAISTLFALPVALLLRRAPTNFARIFSLAFLGPLLIPSIIFALALYQIMILSLGSANLFALIIGHIIITMPHPVRTITAVTENLDPALEDAASSVGAPPFYTFLHVTLPLIKSGVLAGFLFAFIHSWNDFSVSIFLSPRDYKPLAILIYEYLLYEYRPVIAAVATWSVLASAVVIFMIDRLVGLNIFLGKRP